jgi:DNA-binding CsgD family transcriptional regulator
MQQKKLKKAITTGKTFDELATFPLTNEQCIYIHDFQQKAITYSRNVETLLGYTQEEFTTELVHSFYHPDDEEMVLRLIRAAVSYVMDTPVWGEGVFSLTYRIRKKDGSFLKVLRQSSIYEIDQTGLMISNLSILNDISYINSGQNVDWKFDTKDFDEAIFRRYVGNEYETYFTPREVQIINWINEGLSSKEIALQQSISSHTVDTHRRKILKKAGCKNAVELLNFCNKIGVLR